MPINVSEALDSDTAEVVTVARTTGAYIDRKFVKNPPTIFKTLASVQPATSDEMLLLPEGERAKSILKFICKKPVYSVKDRDGLPADEISYKGSKYKVVDAADWSSYGHNTVLGAKL